MPNLSWNPDENRLRAGWRVLLQIVLVLLPLLAAAFNGMFTSGAWANTRLVAIALPVTILVVLFLGRYIDKRRFTDFGVHLQSKRWWQDYGFGVLLGFGAALGLVVMLVLSGTAGLQLRSLTAPTGSAFWLTSLVILLTYLGVGIFEELLRVYQVRNINEGLAHSRLGMSAGMLAAVLLAALNSLVMHIASLDWLFLVFVLISAVFYGLYYQLTGSAALAMAQHFAWDFTISYVFLLGGAAGQEAHLFQVLIRPDSMLDTAIWLPICGLAAESAAFAVALWWIRRRQGQVRLQPALTQPSLRQEALEPLAKPTGL